MIILKAKFSIIIIIIILHQKAQEIQQDRWTIETKPEQTWSGRALWKLLDDSDDDHEDGDKKKVGGSLSLRPYVLS